MEEEIKYNYISLQEATKCCCYSQEYLSLRARQGKLKAVKFGRNWVTKEEWLKEYLTNVENYNGDLQNNKPTYVKFISPPVNLPVVKGPALRVGFAAALIFVLISASFAFGKESFQNVYTDSALLIEQFNAAAEKKIASFNSELENQIANLGEKISIYKNTLENDILAEISGPEILNNIKNNLKGYGQRMVFDYSLANDFLEGKIENLVSNLKMAPLRLVKNYSDANESLEKEISQLALRGKEVLQKLPGLERFIEKAVKEYSAANETLEKEITSALNNVIAGLKKAKENYLTTDKELKEKITQGWQKITGFFTGTYRFLTNPWKTSLLEKLASQEKIDEIQQEVESLKKEGLIVKEVTKEVSKVTEVQPVKEVSKETVISRIDETTLAQVRADIVELQEGLAQRLYAPGGVISQQIYIREPVASPKIYQENADIVLQAVGTGNVILSAGTGMQISGKQVVIDSTSVQNPLVYIADQTRIGGRTDISGPVTAQAITLNAPSGYGKILDVQSENNTKFSIEDTGAATLIGNFAITGNLNVSGTQSFTASSTSAALTVTQNGLGNIVEFKDGSTSVFTIADGGFVTLTVNVLATTTPAFLIRASDADFTGVTSTYFGIAATSTFAGRIVDFQTGGTSVFYIDGSGNTVIGGTLTVSTTTSQVTGNLIMAGDIIPATTTLYNLGSDTYKWANIYTATATIGNTITINTNTISGSATTTFNTTDGSIILSPAQYVGIGTTAPITQLHVSGMVPTSLSTTTTGTNPRSIYVQGRYAYITNDGSATLQIIDVSNPSSPTSIATTTTGANPRSVYVQGRYAYVLSSTASTTQIFDVSNPSSPSNVGTITTNSNPRSIYIQGRYAYVVNYNVSTLQIIDVSNPSSPTSIAATTTGANPRSVYVQGRYAYVANYTANTLQVFDISNPSSPTSVATTTTGANPFSVYVQGRYAYIVNYTANTLQIIDVSNPSSPISAATTTTEAGPVSVYAQGRYAYVINNTANTLQVFDISNPSSPTSAATTSTELLPSAIFVQGHYAYVVNDTSNTLQIFDVGGAYIQQLEAGGIETGTLSARNNLQVGNDLDVRGGLQVARSIETTDSLSAYASTAVSVLTVTQSGTGYGAIITGGNVAIGTSTAATLFSVATSTNIFNILSNGNIGIGTTSPAYTLSVVGNIYGSGNAIFNNTLTVSATSNLATTTITGGYLGVGTTTPASTLGVFGTSTFMGGYVGMGTITPIAPLHINRTGASADSWITFSESAESEYWSVGLNDQSANSFRIARGTTLANENTFVVINTSGYVGIGTTSPVSLLEVYGQSANTDLTITSATSSTYDSRIVFKTGAGAPTTRLVMGVDQSDSNKFKIATSTLGTNDILTIDYSTGYLGIGTSSPRYFLDVLGSASFGTTTDPDIPFFTINVNSGYATQSIKLVNEVAGGGTIAVYKYTDDSGGAAMSQYKARGTAAAPVIIQADDTLGGFSLYAYDGSNFYSVAKVRGFVDGTPGDQDLPTRLVFETTPDNSTTSQERMRIDSSGNVGIGTTTPASALGVFGTSTFMGGNFGIGTTSPVYTLSVVGNIYGSGNAIFGGTLAVSGTTSFATTTITGDLLPATTALYNLGSASAKWANIYIATATIGNTITINTNSISGSATTTFNTTAGSIILSPTNYVGIGTADPITKLDVIDSSRVPLLTLGSGNIGSWTKVGGDGTGWADAIYEAVRNIISYNGKLYAALGSGTGDAEVWEFSGATSSWTKIGGDGLGWADATYERIESVAVYKGKLYVGLGNSTGDAELWEYNGSTWVQVGGDGTGWADVTYERVQSLATYNGRLYAGLGLGAGDAEVWEYDGSNWNQVAGSTEWATTTFDIVYALNAYNNKLYAGLGQTTGEAEVWEYDGSTWTKIGGDGLGWADNEYENVYSFANYNGKMYTGIGYSIGDAEVWEFSGATSSWTKIGGDGLGWADATYHLISSLGTYNGRLYAGLSNSTGYAELWEYDGSTWTKIGGDGLGWADAIYEQVSSLFAYNGKLYAGIGTDTGEGELWEYDGSSYTTLARHGVGLSIGDYLYFGRNNYIGIGKPEPESELDIKGNIRVSDSLLVTNAGNVGIGTTSPAYTLSVVGNIYGSGNAIFNNTLTVSATSNLATTTITGGYLGVGTTTPASTLGVFGTSTFMGGNVGIGMVNPAFTLDVLGSFSVGTANQFQVDSGGYIGASGLSVGDLNFSPSVGGIITTGNVGIATSSPRYTLDVYGGMAVGTGTIPSFYVASTTGNVGIGTTSPTYTLSVVGSIYGSGNAIFGGTLAVSGTTSFATTTITGDLLPSANATYNLGSGSAKWANIYAATATIGGTITINSTDITSSGVLNITSGGFSTLTTSGLTIKSAGTIIATSTGNIVLTLGDAAGTNKFFITDSTGATSTALLTLTSDGKLGIGTTTPVALFSVATSTNILVANISGMVGIGTANPTAPLQISENFVLNKGLLMLQDTSGSGAPYISFYDTPESLKGFLGFVGSSNFYIQNIENGNIFLYTNNAARMTIKNTGLIGIGTTSPASLLEVYSQSADTDLTITAATSSTYDSRIVFRTGSAAPTTRFVMGVDQSDSNKFKIATSTLGTNDILAIDPTTGYIGIGTTTPTDKLHVAGFIRTDNVPWVLSYDFGANANWVFSLAVYNGKLYAGLGNDGGESDIYSFDGSNWTLSNDFAASTTYSLAVYKGKLYAGLGGAEGDGDIYSFDGSTWSLNNDFGASVNSVTSLAVYNGKLYAGLGFNNGDADVYVYDGSTWSLSYDFGTNINLVHSLAVYNGKLYAGLGWHADEGDVYVYDGSTWSLSYDFGANIEYVFSLAVYNDKLYAGLAEEDGDGDVYSFDGSNWTLSKDFGASINGVLSLAVYNGKLYAGSAQDDGDGNIYVFDGSTWATSTDLSSSINSVRSLAVYNGKLYAGLGDDNGDADIYVYSERLESQLAKEFNAQNTPFGEQYQNFTRDLSIIASSTLSTSSALTVSQNGAGYIVDFKDATTSVFTIIDGGNVGIGTSTPATLFSVATSTNIFNVTTGGRVGVGTTSPTYTLSVVGSIYGSGNAIFGGSLAVSGTTSFATTTITGDLLPSANATYNLGSGSAKWANIYTATATIGNTITINTNSIVATSSLNLTGAAASTWQVSGGALTIQTDSQNLILQTITSGNLSITSAGNLAETFGSASNYSLTQGATARLAIDTSGNITATGTSLALVGTTTFSDYLGIATTSSPTYPLTVQGNIYGSGNAIFGGSLAVSGTTSFATTTITGDLLPSANATYNLGSDTYKWANIYTATATIGGTLTLNSTDITGSGALNLTGAAASLWKTTSGNLTIQSANVLTASSTGDIILTTAASERMRIASSTGYVGIGTSTAATLFSVATSTNIFNVTTWGRVGVGTTSPAEAFSVTGNILGSGNIVVQNSAATSSFYGALYSMGTTTLGQATSTPVIFTSYVKSNILPYTDSIYDLGSSFFKWRNIYTATATIGGTLTLNSTDITGSGALNLTGAAASLWKTTSGNLTIQSANALTASSTGDVILATAGTERMRIASTTGYMGIGTSTPAYTLDTYGTFRASSTSTFNGNIVFTGATSTVYIPFNATSSWNISDSTNTYMTLHTTQLGQQIVMGADVAFGTMQIDQDAGAVSFVDFPVTSNATTNTEESYAFQIDSNAVFKIYSQSDGAGGTQNRRVLISNVLGAGGTPSSLLELQADSTNTALTITSATSSTFDPVIIFKTATSMAERFYLGVDQSDSNKFKIATSTLGTNDILTIDGGTGYLAIGSSTAATLFSVATSTNIFNILSNGNIGIGTTSPAYTLSVVGNIYGSGNAIFGGTLAVSGTTSFATTTITGDLLPATTATYNLGSDTYKWANIYAATATIGGAITINSTDITGSGALNLTGATASTWQVSGGALTIQVDSQNLTLQTVTSGNLAIASAGGLTETFALGSGYSLVHGTTARLAFDSSGNLTATGTTIAFAGDTTITGAATTTSSLGVGGVLTMSGNIVMSDNSITGIDTLAFTDVSGTIAGIQNQNLLDKTADETVIGTWGLATTTITGDFTVNTNQLYIQQSTGNVGIGTTTPASTLGVFGTSTFMGGNVGIGTTNPTEKLDVNGNILLTGSSGFDADYETASLIMGSANWGIIASRGDGLYFDVYKSGSTGKLGASAYDAMIIKASTGNVGIGTTSPATLFSVATSTNIFNVLSNGNIGIGTSSPAYTLSVVGNIYGSGNAIFNGTLNVSATSSLATTTIIGGYLGVGTTTPASTLSVFGTSTFMGGNVGIGTANPSGKLHIVGGGSPLQIIYNSGVNLDAFHTFGLTDENAYWYYGLDDHDNKFGLGFSSSAITSNMPDTNRFLTILTTGNVGIGTTTPASLLEVYDNDADTDLTITSATSTTYDARLVFRTGAVPTTQFVAGVDQSDSNKFKIATSTLGTNDILTIDSGTGYLAIGSSTAATLFSVATSTNIFNILSNGNIGIGTTSPAYTLSVVGNIYGSGNAIFNNTLTVSATSNLATTTITGGYLGVGTTTPASTLGVFGTSTFMGGNVGIGTTSASGLLELYSNTVNAELLRLSRTAGTYVSFVTPSGAPATMNITANGTVAMKIYAASGYTGDVQIDQLYIDTSADRVVVGATSAASIFEVYDNDADTDLTITSATSSTYDARLVFRTGSTPAVKFALGVDLSDSNKFKIATSTLGTGDILAIDYSAGYVGIGTSSPASILSVYASSTATALTVTQEMTGNIINLKAGATAVLTLKSADQLKYRAGLAQTWGTINDLVLDDFEDNDVTNWTSSDSANTRVAATTTYIKVNDYSLAVSASSSSSNNDTATTSVSTADWSSYERLGFWIKADYMTTSTEATTTQMISAQFASSSSATTHNITIKKTGEWQYQEWDISGVPGRTGMSWLGFRIDYDYGSPVFYIDQIRLYDSDLQAGEMFVDNKGNFVIWGQKSVEIGRTSASEGSLPSIKADTAVVEFNQPLSVNVGGDVGFDYDIYFANTGLSSISSEGSLQIVAGDPNHYENLTLAVGGTGDIIMNIASSTIGFKVLGSDSGGYVFRVAPSGDVEIGGSGSGGSDLTVKQNLTLTGGNITVSFLPTTTAPTISATSTGGSCAAGTYYYLITAANDNGQTLGSATTSKAMDAGNYVNVSWTPVTGATKHYVWRSVDNIWGSGDNDDYRMEVLAPNTSYMDDCTSTQATSTFPTVNTTGGNITVNGNILPATTTATSSSWNLGALGSYWSKSYIQTQYTGDIIFANQFVLTEATATSSPQALIFQNASSTPILSIDENGKLTTNKLVANEIETEKISIKDSEISKTGITIYDRTTGEPYCVYFESGQMKTASGTCSVATGGEAVDFGGGEGATSSATSSEEAPETIMISGPASETTSTEAAFEFFADQNNCTFQCKVNSWDFENCSSPKTYYALTPGDYAFQVFATNELGRYDATPASSTWRVVEEAIVPSESTSTEETATTTGE